MNDVKLYTRLHKSQLIKIYRNMLKEKDLYAPKHNDGYGVNKGQQRCLRRPKTENQIYSWAEFNRLPKAAIIVYVYMNGVDVEYLTNAVNNNPKYSFLEEEE